MFHPEGGIDEALRLARRMGRVDEIVGILSLSAMPLFGDR